MGNRYMLLLFLLLFTCPGLAEFDPERLSQSTVKVLIKTKQGVIGTASGFLWQSNTQVVTSLHVLSNDPSSKIIVELGKKKRLAKIKSVLPKADLALLTISRPVDGYLPLKTFNGEKPKYKSEVSALGFNQGSLGLSTRELRKGYVKPELLQVLLPPDALLKLSNSEVPDVKLPIYYLDGSLLPGYSGSPVVDAKGTLIGIGDGGLENGAASVSWVIPATNLPLLEQSKISTLPESFALSSSLFNGDRLTPGQQYKRTSPLALSMAPEFSWPWSIFQAGLPLMRRVYANPFYSDDLPDFFEVNYHQFTFIKSKSRSYRQLLASSGTPDNIDQVWRLFNQLFHGYRLDHYEFVFDVYQDGRFGLNIAVPQGVELTVDEQGFLLAQGQMFCRSCDYEIQYHARRLNATTRGEIEKAPEQFLHQVAQQHWLDLNDEGDYGEYSDFRTIETFGASRYVLRAAFSDFSEPFKDKFELNYFTAASNRDAWFQAQGILNRFDDDFFRAVAANRGTDCRDPNLVTSKAELCLDIETMLKVMISVHLTSFSNQFFP